MFLGHLVNVEGFGQFGHNSFDLLFYQLLGRNTLAADVTGKEGQDGGAGVVGLDYCRGDLGVVVQAEHLGEVVHWQGFYVLEAGVEGGVVQHFVGAALG